jgi:predicted metallopeptidase
MFGRKKRGGKMRYEYAPDLKMRTEEIVRILGMGHVNLNRIECIRSFGSSTKRTIARCHALGKVMQHGMKTPAFYTIEFLELFDRMPKEEQDKTIIHELMHIPKSFGGGFRHHDYVCDRNVELLHQRFESVKRKDESLF